jgi:hypothetical protein
MPGARRGGERNRLRQRLHDGLRALIPLRELRDGIGCDFVLA